MQFINLKVPHNPHFTRANTAMLISQFLGPKSDTIKTTYMMSGASTGFHH